ncbi:squalene epoxidase 3 [Selaginella moellendorffii]|nr:squalene epoxidase 3 [Selaginella moellendorffii]|eukprot:XP_024538071.1 squalene epoxidase 3 [Selaginella moellendorffii]
MGGGGMSDLGMAQGLMRHICLLPPLSIVVALLALLMSLTVTALSRKVSSKSSNVAAALVPPEKERGGVEREGDAVDCIVVGAGIAGAALAYALGKDSRRVLLIERDCSEPDRIVGELLQPGGYLKLVELGMKDCVDEIEAQRVHGYALFKDGRDAKVGYPLKGRSEDVAGRSFHHGRFVQRLRQKADSLHTVKLVEGTVLSLIEGDGIVKGVRYRVKKEDGVQVVEAYAPITFVCDGYSSNLRKNLCTPKVDVPSHFVGLILENCHLPYSNFGHVVLANPSPILFYPISNTEIRCLVDCPKEVMQSVRSGKMAHHLINNVAPQLPVQLRDSFIAAASDTTKIRSMENKIMPAVPIPKPGALLLGDAFNMRHPLTGGGMTVALSDVVLLRDMLRPVVSFKDQAAVCSYLQAFYTRRKPVASTINTLAGALYRVFCASPDVAMTEMTQACFDYLSLGGVFSSGPVALLSGLNPRPLSLVAHFFAVAFFGVGRLLLRYPSPKNFWVAFRLVKGAASIIFPIIQAEGVVQMFFPWIMTLFYRSPLHV